MADVHPGPPQAQRAIAGLALIALACGLSRFLPSAGARSAGLSLGLAVMLTWIVVLFAPTTARIYGSRSAVIAVAMGLVSALLAWPSTVAQAADLGIQPSYQPFGCDTSGASGTTQNRRQTFGLKSSGNNTDFDKDKAMHPCLSGVSWNMSFGNIDDTVGTHVAANVQGIYTKTRNNVDWAYSDANASLVQLAFSSLTVNSNVAAYGGVVISANSASDGLAPSAKTPNTLSIMPANSIAIGGTGVTTEVLAYGDSTISLPWSVVKNMCTAKLSILLSWICDALKSDVCNGGVKGANCVITLSMLAGTASGNLGTFISAIVSSLAAGGDFNLVAMNLRFKYLFTHKPDGTADPYAPTNAPANPNGHSIELPATVIEVCQNTQPTPKLESNC